MNKHFLAPKIRPEKVKANPTQNRYSGVNQQLGFSAKMALKRNTNRISTKKKEKRVGNEYRENQTQHRLPIVLDKILKHV